METWDTGYITSFSWRIINGQHVYEDFLYKFPPVTIYLHAFFMKIVPEVGQFFYFRIIAYLSFALQVYFFVSAIYLLYDIKKVNKWAMMIVCFLVSWMNFSPYPWPTTDGIFFASIAFWLVAKYKNLNFIQLFCVALFCLLSALSKQSFYLVPLFFLVWIYFKDGKTKFILLSTNYFILLVSFIFLINSITTWSNFTNQINGELRLYDLYSVGIHKYLILPIRFFIVFIVFVSIFIILYLRNKKQNISSLFPRLKELAFLLIITAIIIFMFGKEQLASQFAFDAAFVAIIYSYLIQKKTINYLFPFVVLLTISWSTSISLGYPAPLLFGTGITLTFITIMEDDIKINQKYYLLISLPICLVAFASNNYPYREDSIFNLTYSLEVISPKLKFINTKKDTFEKHLELKKLIAKYGENFIVAPNMPMSNYLFNDQSELPTDWLIETEINRRINPIIRMCANKKNYIFLEKSFVTKEDYGIYTVELNSISCYIYKHFNKIDETKYFIIYNQIKANEKLP